MASYYNEHDPYAAQWLRNLIAAGHIAAGDVDERDIQDVQPDDVRSYIQCHFFAGIGGWSYALRLAGWPDDRPVWTGSCPCQPFSSAARGRTSAEDCWPWFIPLIADCRPQRVFGEQVASSGAWVDGLCDDMEALDYTIWAAVCQAYGVGLDHARQRFYFACDANSDSQSRCSINAQVAWMSRHRGVAGGVVRSDGLPTRMAGVFSGFGNAIVPQVAAEFLSAYLEVRP